MSGAARAATRRAKRNQLPSGTATSSPERTTAAAHAGAECGPVTAARAARASEVVQVANSAPPITRAAVSASTWAGGAWRRESAVASPSAVPVSRTQSPAARPDNWLPTSTPSPSAAPARAGRHPEASRCPTAAARHQATTTTPATAQPINNPDTW